MTEHNKYDLSSPAFESNPYPTYAAMQRDDPVYRHEWSGGNVTWYITGYEYVEAILRDNKRFIKNYRHTLTPEEHDQMSPVSDLHKMIDGHLLNQDPPDHTRLRSLVNKAFTSRRINQLQGRVQNIADSLLDRVQDKGEMDLIDDYAFQLPIIVIAELLGLPIEDRDRLRTWSNAFIAPIHNDEAYEAFAALMQDFTLYLTAMFTKRRQDPQDDLITALVQAEEEGDKLTESELSSMLVLLIVAGHETTVNLIGTGLLTLLQNPDQLQQLKDNPALIEATVEELLRYDGPVETSTVRWSREDVEIGGQLIRRKEPIEVVLCAANRDPAKFKDPAVLNLMRDDNRHLAFGFGIHYCLGAPLARIEGKIALNTLLQRLPNLRLGEPVAQLKWRRTPPVRGLEHVRVVWD